MVKDKVVLITGGTRGIGFKTAEIFLKNGAKVIIFGSKKESVDKALDSFKNMNYDVDGYYPDLCNYDEVNKVIKEIYDKYKRIDVLINNAGISQNGKIENISSDDFENIMNINVNALFNVSKCVIEYMKNTGGVILNTSSMVSLYGQASGVGYPASKFAVNGITKSLAKELGCYNIRVNAVAPGVINTDMVKNLPKEMIDPIVKKIPIGRIGETSDVANAFLFLASDMASYITGAILSVDGACQE